MNKKGFTLIEIIVIIAVIAAVSTSGTIMFTKTVQSFNQAKLNELTEQIEYATDVYFNKYPHIMEELYKGYTGDTICTKLYMLQNDGLLNKNLINPITHEIISGTLCVYSTLDENGNIVHEFTL